MDNGTEYIAELLRQWGGWEMELQYGTGEQIDCWVRRQAASGEETGMIRAIRLSGERSKARLAELKDSLWEAQAMSSLPNIASVMGCVTRGSGDGEGYAVLIRMERLTPLFAYHGIGGDAGGEAASLGVDICSALEALRERGICHGAVTLENILVSDEGAARLTCPGLDASGASEKSVSADLFALGQSLRCFAAELSPRFPANNREKALDKILQAACGGRYATPGEMKEALARYLAPSGGEDGGPDDGEDAAFPAAAAQPRKPGSRPLPKPRGQKRTGTGSRFPGKLAAILALILLLAAAGVCVFLLRDRLFPSGRQVPVSAAAAPTDAPQAPSPTPDLRAAAAPADLPPSASPAAVGSSPDTAQTPEPGPEEDGAEEAQEEEDPEPEGAPEGAPEGEDNPYIWQITVSAGAGGTITPGNRWLPTGGSQTYTIRADSGYAIAEVLVDGRRVDVTESYTFSDVSANHSISALFRLVSAPTEEPGAGDAGGGDDGGAGAPEEGVVLLELGGETFRSNVTKLNIQSKGITDISVLAQCTDLTWLNLNNNKISDLTPLSGLTSLTSLFLNHNSITNIQPLAGLKNLTTLQLQDNAITDWSPVDFLPYVAGRP